MFLEAEDYLEPQCPLKRMVSPAAVKSSGKIPLEEVIAECDRLFNSEDQTAVGNHLRKWLEKAEKLGGIITFDFQEGEGFEIRSSLPESLKIKGEKNEN